MTETGDGQRVGSVLRGADGEAVTAGGASDGRREGRTVEGPTGVRRRES